MIHSADKSCFSGNHIIWFSKLCGIVSNRLIKYEENIFEHDIDNST